jgi:hypothetical protein
MKRVILAGLVATAALGAAPTLHANETQPQGGAPNLGTTGATPSFATLPEGHVPPPPGTPAPARIAANEKAAGFVVAPQPSGWQTKINHREAGTAYVFPDAERAKEFSRSESRGEGDGECLVDGGDGLERGFRLRLGRFEDVEESEGGGDADMTARGWPTNYASVLSLNFMLTNEQGVGPNEVHAVHREHLVAGADGHATLEMADAWVDARTRGARQLGTSTMQLSRIFVGPNGLEVYGARDGDSLQVVVRKPTMAGEDPLVAQQMRQRLRNLNAQLPDSSFGSTDCGHMRFVLKAPPGGAQMASIQSTAFLPPLEGEQAMRQRPFHLGVSASSSTTDKNPIVSISLGWIGGERRGTEIRNRGLGDFSLQPSKGGETVQFT